LTASAIAVTKTPAVTMLTAVATGENSHKHATEAIMPAAATAAAPP